MQLPSSIRNMPIIDLCNKFNGEISLALTSLAENSVDLSKQTPLQSGLDLFYC